METLAHVVIPLIDIFKGDTEIRHNLQDVVNHTASNLKVGWWIKRLND